jgi:hypothetical protein
VGRLIEYAIALVLLWRFSAAVVRYCIRPKDRGNQRLYELFVFLAIIAELPYFFLLVDAGTDLIARRMDIYVEGRQDFLQSETAKAALGGSLRIGWPIENAVDISGGNGSATLHIPVRGVSGFADLEVSGVKKDGVWKIVDLLLIPHGSKETIEIAH